MDHPKGSVFFKTPDQEKLFLRNSIVGERETKELLHAIALAPARCRVRAEVQKRPEARAVSAARRSKLENTSGLK
jgi:hypothetical protein